MRIPHIPIMKRLAGEEDWSLLTFLTKYLNSVKATPISLIDYNFGGGSNVKSYNGKRMTTKEYKDILCITDPPTPWEKKPEEAQKADPLCFSNKKNATVANPTGQGLAVPDKYVLGEYCPQVLWVL